MTHVHSNWKNSYPNGITSTNCYAGCTGITHIDDEYVLAYDGDSGVDYIPTAWGGGGFTTNNSGVYEVEIPSDSYTIAFKGSIEGAGKINWGDGTVTTNETEHTYTTSGTYRIKSQIWHNPHNPTGNPAIDPNFKSSLTKVYRVPKDNTGRYNYSLRCSFQNCSKLTYANLTNLDVDKYTMCPQIFNNCTALTDIIFPNGFLRGCTSNTEGASSLFSGCTSLQTIDVSNWDVSNVITLSSIFSKCSKLTNIIGIETWDTSNVTSVSNMFRECTSLNSFPAIENWNMSKCYTFDYMFFQAGCSGTFRPNWNLASLGNSGGNGITRIFAEMKGTADTIIDLSNCTVPENNPVIKAVGYVFSDNPYLTQVKFPNNLKLRSMDAMFSNCIRLTSVDLTPLDLSECGSMSRAFYGCTSLTSLDLSGIDMVSISRDYSNMCNGCTNLSIILPSTIKGTSFNAMFKGCISLTDLRGTTFEDTVETNPERPNNVDGMSFMFQDCNNLEYIGTLINRGGLRGTFINCNSLKSIEEFRFNRTDGAYDSYIIFQNINNPNTIDINFTVGSGAKGPGNLIGSRQNNTWWGLDLSRDTVVKLFNCFSRYSEYANLGTGNIGSRSNPLGFKDTTQARLTDSDIAIATAKGWTIG